MRRHAAVVGLLLYLSGSGRAAAPAPKKAEARTLVLDVDVAAVDKPGSKKTVFELKEGQSFPLLKSDGTWCSLGAGGLGSGWVHCARGHLLKAPSLKVAAPETLPLITRTVRLEIDPAKPKIYACDVDTDVVSRERGERVVFHAERAGILSLLAQSEDLIWCKISRAEKEEGWLRCDRIHVLDDELLHKP